MIILSEQFNNPNESKAEQLLTKFLVAKDLLFQHYTQLVEPMLIPDLHGKTVRVSPSTFPFIDKQRLLISKYLRISPPEIFVYENFYYGAEIVGLTKPWMEISSKTISDFSPQEITFLIAQQFSHIYLHHYVLKTHSEQLLKSLQFVETTTGINLINLFGTIDGLEEAIRLVYYNWTREIAHTADFYGLLFCGKIDVAVNVIIKMIINNSELAESVNKSEYIKSNDYFSSLDGVVSFYTKLDEPLPYGPVRIAEMIKYLSLSSNKQLFNKMKATQEEINA